MRPIARAVMLTALVASALVSPLGGRAVGRACAAGTTHVAIIVDLGSGSSVSALCVPAGSSSNGATILAARASMLGTPQPRYGPSGLLCAIDGVPSTGCGVVQNGHYMYWSYWHGSGGSWSYSNIGPASTGADAAVVEGWRWQPQGAGRPTDPAPRGPATASTICVPPAPPTTARAPVTNPRNTVTTRPSTPVTAAHSATTGGPDGPTGTTNPATGAHPAPSTTAKPTTGATATTRAGTSGNGRSPTTFADPTATSVELVPRGIAAPTGRHSSGGLPVGAIVGVLLVLGLGGAGAYAARRRSRAPS
jgi:hypothetical protein